jgi:hypothetical protein
MVGLEVPSDAGMDQELRAAVVWLQNSPAGRPVERRRCEANHPPCGLELADSVDPIACRGPGELRVEMEPIHPHAGFSHGQHSESE